MRIYFYFRLLHRSLTALIFANEWRYTTDQPTGVTDMVLKAWPNIHSHYLCLDYQSNYVANKGGGFGMEMHEFHHMVCPLQDDSGYFILGKKISADEMHLTGSFTELYVRE